jgi:hypothetical protein
VCGRKNYRLQDIQLSKTLEASSRQLTATSQIERRLRGELPLKFLPPFPRQLVAGRWNLEADMENTGLEPVTSWLQTRRSPS